jgi:hypothetical protein
MVSSLSAENTAVWLAGTEDRRTLAASQQADFSGIVDSMKELS